jgi:hypothetical protein
LNLDRKVWYEVIRGEYWNLPAGDLLVSAHVCSLPWVTDGKGGHNWGIAERGLGQTFLLAAQQLKPGAWGLAAGVSSLSIYDASRTPTTATIIIRVSLCDFFGLFYDALSV